MNFENGLDAILWVVFAYGLVFPTIVALSIIGVLPASMITWGIGSMLPVATTAFFIGALSK